MRKYPALVSKLASLFDGWIIGSAANPDNPSPRDYDVMVPFSQWQMASSLIPKDATPNTFGGWKCISEGVEVDVWPGELSWVMSNHCSTFAYHFRTGTLLTKSNNF